MQNISDTLTISVVGIEATASGQFAILALLIVVALIWRRRDE
ncbi:hypothetical protein OIU34_02455 [Pararhizobium sp. BT-229]|nr:hypothetical protein [Pararhizobium sp. BT-229]MCV9960749.1 hypothetical protein [Pararhizobium sp. BT-229]